MKFCLAVLISILAVSGCTTTPVVTKVTRFNAFGVPSPSKQTFAFSKANPSLEEASYRSQIAQSLENLGWRQVSAEKASYKVSFDWKIDRGIPVQESSPILGTVGGGTSTTSGTISRYGGGTSTYSGNTYSAPVLGVVGETSSTTMYYTRELDLRIGESQTGRQVFQGKVASVGMSSSMTEIMPFLVEGLFHQFPGTNGKMKVYSFPVDDDFRPTGPIKEIR